MCAAIASGQRKFDLYENNVKAEDMFIPEFLKSVLRASAAFMLLVTSFASFSIAEEVVSPALYSSMEWRMVGPYRGGRVLTVTGVTGNPMLYYMGASGGGVWKTENAGVTWENISDGYFNVGTIGAVAVAPSDPNVLYVGTGEAPIRGVTTSSGDGVYKSTDAGATWQHVGLPKAGQISRIKIHPGDPDTAYVAVQGNMWAPTDERGIYRTTDGGETWEQVLSVGPTTGATDLAMDPTNPRILYASMWHHGRTPWFILSGGTDGGIFKSVDGGDTWEKLSGGLPELIGKVGVDVSASNPQRVYAIVEADAGNDAGEGKGGLYRSDDGGENWTLINNSRIIQTRSWYYHHITADPVDEDIVYVMNAPFMKSIDGGVTFEKQTLPHGDFHDHWVNPENRLNQINASDGGATITFDGGKTWSSIMNQPTAQFYRVITDNQTPYRIYGGQQDNSTVAIASETYDSGIGREDYFAVGGGESAHIAFDEENPQLIYATTINGTLTEYNVETERRRPIKPYPEYVFGHQSKNLRYRTNWNAPVIVSQHNTNVIYYGTHKVLKSDDRGVTWQEVSPDLTRNQIERQGDNGGPLTNELVGAEFYNTIFYMVESPYAEGELWIGSDDGLIHLSRDGGASWDNITPTGAPEALVNAIEISPHSPGTAYAALAAYKLNDFSPYIFKTTDYGESWTRIDNGLPENTFVRVVREDPERAGLLYAGTEAGMFVSFDGGSNWQSLALNLPPVPITDLTLRQGDLIAATQGRGFWVLDDVSPLRQANNDMADKPLHVFTPSVATLLRSGGRGAPFEGANPRRGVILNYYIGEDVQGPLSIEILGRGGDVIRTFSSAEGEFDACVLGNSDDRRPFHISYPSADAGQQSWAWDMRREGLYCIDDYYTAAGFNGASAIPGDYQARFSIGGATETVSFALLPDPRVEAGDEAYAFLDARLEEVTNLMNELMDSLKAVRASREQIMALMDAHPGSQELTGIGGTAVRELTAWEDSVTQKMYETYEDEDTWASLIDVQIRHLLDVIDGAGAPVANGALERLADLKAEWAMRRGELEGPVAGAVTLVNEWVSREGIAAIGDPAGETR
jgi:photosystem II stability/assembly factor-like uncharacterized protein